MRYQHSLEIHQRLETVLGLIRTGKYSTPALAEEVGVSIPTISRIVAALREQGHDIRAERAKNGWRYVLAGRGSRKDKAEAPETANRAMVSKPSGHDD